MAKKLDCVVVGYNEIDLQTSMASRQAMQASSGAYHHMLTNVVRLENQWYDYMGLLNTVLEKASGKQYHLHTMELPSLAACTLASYLKKKGFEIEIVNSFNRDNPLFSELLTQAPRAVAVTTTFYVEAAPIKEIARFVKEQSPETLVIVGGPHIYNLWLSQEDSTTLDYAFEEMGADIYVIDAQGEITLGRVLAELRKGAKPDLSRIPNLAFRPTRANGHARASGVWQDDFSEQRVGAFARTLRDPENGSLDESIVDTDSVPQELLSPTALVRTARSCAYACSFCRYPIVAGPFVLASPDTIRHELRQLGQIGTEHLIFVDDTFNVPLPRFKALLRMMISEGFKFRWFSHFRCSKADPETFELMQESGCAGVFLGIESGDPTILKHMNKQSSLDAYRIGIRALREHAIDTFASVIVGFPGETAETVQATIDLIEETQPTFFKAEVYYHALNVPIAQQAAQFGLRGGSYSWRHRTMDWREACRQVDRMYRTVKGSLVFPGHMFDFWSIPYLLGKGLLPEQISEFVLRTRPLLLANLDGPSPSVDGKSLPGADLLALGKRMALQIDSHGTAGLV